MNLEKKFYIKRKKTTIIDSIYWLIYNHLAKDWIENYKNDYLKEKRDDYSTIYYFKLTDTFKQELVQCNSFFDWKFPEKMDNICFYKNNKCWLYSVAHEQICDIYCDSKEEFEYLKSIGVKFIEKEYTPEKCILFVKY